MGQKSDFQTLPHWGCLTVQITSKFIADLKRLATLPEKIREYDSLLKGYDWRFSTDSWESNK